MLRRALFLKLATTFRGKPRKEFNALTFPAANCFFLIHNFKYNTFRLMGLTVCCSLGFIFLFESLKYGVFKCGMQNCRLFGKALSGQGMRLRFANVPAMCGG